MTCGVYEICCIPTGRRYIGSSVGIERRWGAHRLLLRRGDHINPRLQSAWNKYKEVSFCFKILQETSVEVLMSAEQRWLDSERPEFNLNPNADAPMRGRKHTPETLAKIRASSLGRRHSAETRATLSRVLKGHKGVVYTPESRARVSAQMMGNQYARGAKRSEAFKENLIKIHTGAKRSLEARARMSQSQMGNQKWRNRGKNGRS